MWKKVCWSLSKIKSEKCLLSCSRWNVHRKSWMKVSLTKAGKRVTSMCSCRHVSVSVQRFSVQYKGYNLVGVTTLEEGAMIGTTALVNWQLQSSLYTGAVQGYWSTPDWSDRRQGCRQVSTVLHFRQMCVSMAVHIQCCWAETICFGSSSGFGSDFQKVSTPAPALAPEPAPAPTEALWVPVLKVFKWKSRFFMTFRKEYWLNSLLILFNMYNDLIH